jgi:hypothetical protein
MNPKIQAFRELPEAMKQTTALALAALFVAVTALVLAMARHAS